MASITDSDVSSIFDKRITIGNLITIATVLVTCVSTIVMYKDNIDNNFARLHQIEQQQKVLESRITLLENEMDKRQNDISNVQHDMQRTIDYLQLLLDKEHIQYVK